MKLRRLLYAGCGLLMACAAGPAAAVTCSMSVSPLAFGSYNPLAITPTDSVATVQVTCSTVVSILVNYSIGLSAGSGTLRDRRMQGDRFTLPYQVYTDSARTQVWGDGTAGTGMETNGYLLAALASITTNMVGYGRILSRQNVAPGSYADTLMVTITY